MATIQGIKFVNLKHFMGREGHGFNAELKMGSKKVGFISDYADGSGTLSIDIHPDYRTVINTVIKEYHDHEMAIENSLYANMNSLHRNMEHTFFELLYKLTNVEKDVKKILKDERSAVVLFHAPKFDMENGFSDGWLTKESIVMYSVPQVNPQHPREILDEYNTEENQAMTHAYLFETVKDFNWDTKKVILQAKN